MRREYDGAKVNGRNDKAETVDSTMCVAHGCPLAGGISDSTQGSDRWFCRFHFGNEPREFDRITNEVRQMKRDGQLVAPHADTTTVADMKSRLKP